MANLAQQQTTTNVEFAVRLGGRVMFTLTDPVMQSMIDNPTKAHVALTEPDVLVRPTRPNKRGFRSYVISLPADDRGGVMDLGYINFYHHRIDADSTATEIYDACEKLKTELKTVMPEHVSFIVSDEAKESSLAARFAKRS